MVDQFSERKRNHQATKTTFLINRVLFSFLPAPGLFFCTSHWPLTSGRQRESPSLASLQLLSSASILNAPVVLFNPDYCRSSSLHTGWSTFRLLKGANTTWLWSHPASVFEGTTATTAQCRVFFSSIKSSHLMNSGMTGWYGLPPWFAPIPIFLSHGAALCIKALPKVSQILFFLLSPPSLFIF